MTRRFQPLREFACAASLNNTLLIIGGIGGNSGEVFSDMLILAHDPTTLSYYWMDITNSSQVCIRPCVILLDGPDKLLSGKYTTHTPYYGMDLTNSSQVSIRLIHYIIERTSQTPLRRVHESYTLLLDGNHKILKSKKKKSFWAHYLKERTLQ